jgi:DNA mismatch endonuclease (patch repair protein)
MADVLTSAQRQLNMSRIRGRDTKPELLIRHGLHARGLRYRLHDGKLPGRPDLVFPRHHAVILVHGCFWHGHDCPRFQLPATRQEFWLEKIEGNRRRDINSHEALLAAGWRVLTVWECSLKGVGKWPSGAVLDACANFVRGSELTRTIAGQSLKLKSEEMAQS